MSEDVQYIITGLTETESDALLARYLAGETTTDENQQVLNWCALNARNSKYVDGLRQLWNTSSSSLSPLPFDADAAWQRIQTRMSPLKERQVEAPNRFRIYRVAAAVAFLIGSAVVIWRMTAISKTSDDATVAMVSITAKTAPEQDTLPDGSLVDLNKGARIDFPKTFTATTREVTLSGEAYFQVQHNKKKPFIIHAGALDVAVLGTVFNVKAYPGRESITVSVESGRVRCKVQNDSLEIGAGEEATYNLISRKFERKVMDTPNSFAFRNKKLIYHGETLRQVINEINDAYHTNFILRNEKLGNSEVFSTFPNGDTQSILFILKESYHIDYQIQDSTIIIDGKPW
jgi:ferric-dicitrate binding protein FerR (iron transport regulator)